MKRNSFLLTLAKQPKTVFALDAGGAVLSAVMLGLALPTIQTWIGMPLNILYVLCIIPLVYLIYDLIVYYTLKFRFEIYIKIIAILNIAYCGLSIFLMYAHWADLTLLGKIYFVGECLIIAIIAFLEWKVSGSLANG